MNFIPFEFLLFLAAFFPIYFILPKKFQKFALLIFNFYYINFYKVEFLYFILGISTLFWLYNKWCWWDKKILSSLFFNKKSWDNKIFLLKLNCLNITIKEVISLSLSNFIKSILNIQDNNISFPEEDYCHVIQKGNYLIKIFKGFLKTNYSSCPHCNSKNIVKNGSRERNIKFIPF